MSHCRNVHCYVHDGETCASGYMPPAACPFYRGPRVGDHVEVFERHCRSRGERAVGRVAAVERVDAQLAIVVEVDFGVYGCTLEDRHGLLAWVWTHRVHRSLRSDAELAAAVLECRLFAMFALERAA